MKIQLTLTHENIKGVFCLENSQITFAQDGTYWYAESDDIAGYGIERVFEDFEAVIDVPLDFTYNDFYRIMMKLIACAELIK